MFDCGINAIFKDMQMQFENDCVKAVQEYGFIIDKKQLEKVITDSKSFYDEGYKQGASDILEKLRDAIDYEEDVFDIIDDFKAKLKEADNDTKRNDL